MAATIRFAIAAPGPSEDAAIRALWYDSIDGAEFAQIGEELVENLELVDDMLSWTLEAADSSRYQMIKTKSAGGIESATGSLLPPLPSNPGMQTVFGSVKEFGSPDWAEGDIVTLAMTKWDIVGGSVVEPSTVESTINANGLFTLLADKGAIVTLQVKDATTGKPYFNKSFTVSEDDQKNIKDY